MTQLTLAKAQTIITAALAHAREKSLAPMAVVVLDARGVLKAYAAEDGTRIAARGYRDREGPWGAVDGGRVPHVGQARGRASALHRGGDPRGGRLADTGSRRRADPRR